MNLDGRRYSLLQTSYYSALEIITRVKSLRELWKDMISLVEERVDIVRKLCEAESCVSV